MYKSIKFLERDIVQAGLMLTFGEILARGGGYDLPTEVYFSGCGFAECIGGKWSSYRRKIAQELVRGNWLVEIKVKGRYYYRLTESAWQQRIEVMRYAAGDNSILIRSETERMF